MRTPRLITSYQTYSDPRLDVKAQSIIGALTGNTNFPETVPTLASFTTVAGNFTDALTLAASRDKVAVSAKNDARKALLDALRLLATNVQSLAEGDRTKLVSSGFDLNAETGGSSLLPPQDFTMSDGNSSGEMKFMVSAVAGAKSYLFEYTLEPLTDDSVWISKATTKREFVFSNLPVGKRIYGRVTVVGTKDREITSTVISRIVQ